MADYPKRESHFAHTTFRLMTKVCAAQEIGSDAMLLVAVILHQEDAKWYKSAVTFYNGQLAPILGFTSWNRLNKARQAAVDSGWLHYEPGGKRKPGIYWGTIPQHAIDVDDSPIDEGSCSTSIVESEGGNGGTSGDEPLSIVKSEGASGDTNPVDDVSTSGSGGASGEEVEGQRGRNGGASGEPPTLRPKPKPKPKKPVTGKAGVLNLVSQEMLADPKRVLDWFAKASTGDSRDLEPTETNKRLVVHLAQRVLRDPKVEDPVKVFVASVRDKNFKMTNAEEDRAIETIKLLERGPPKKRTGDLSGKSKSKEQQLKEAKASPLWNGSSDS